MVYLFWASIFVIFYAYLGYPLMLWLLSHFCYKRRKEYSSSQSPLRPNVSLIISAYNEEEVIEQKLQNALELHYPKDLLEIVVVSDGSDDKTNQIVKKYESQGVLLRHFEGRNGKTKCLNDSIPLAKGDLVVFSDANSLYNKEALIELVKHFTDKNIGFVTGHTKYSIQEGTTELKPIGIYSKLEKITKQLESRISSCVGADGAIFAIRKELYEPLNDYDINDFVIPLKIISKGYRGTIEENAYCTEGTAKGTKGEFKRQVRITNRTIRALFNNKPLFNPLKYGIFSLQLISHKLLKYLIPIFLVIVFLTNVLVLKSGILYYFLFFAQVTFYVFSIIEYKNSKFKFIDRILSVAHTFTIVNIAIVLGWIKYIKGEKFTTWVSTR